VGFLTQLVAWAQERYPVDPNQVFATGASNGGMMTQRLLIEASDVFTGGVAFIAALPEDNALIPTPATPRPILLVNGTEDPLVPWDGGQVARNRGAVRSSEAMVDWWLNAHGLSANQFKESALADADPSDGCTLTRYDFLSDQQAMAPVSFVQMSGGGHAMPSPTLELPNNRWVQRMIGPICRDVDGVDLAWDFLSSLRNR
jgi:polyhydroxybutyrate depolymerase